MVTNEGRVACVDRAPATTIVGLRVSRLHLRPAVADDADMEHHDDRPTTTRVRTRVAQPVDVSGAVVALLGALLLLLLLL